MVQKGEQQGFSPDEMQEAIAYLQELGYQSDRRLVEQIIQTGLNKYGKAVLKRKCYSKGLDPVLFEQVWQESAIDTDVQELDELKAKIQRKYHIEDFADLEPKTYRKVCQYLQYRGFHPREVLDAWND
nr:MULTISPECIES: regulatory protein RecX [unclassified Desertifilum]